MLGRVLGGWVRWFGGLVLGLGSGVVLGWVAGSGVGWLVKNETNQDMKK